MFRAARVSTSPPSRNSGAEVRRFRSPSPMSVDGSSDGSPKRELSDESRSASRRAPVGADVQEAEIVCSLQDEDDEEIVYPDVPPIFLLSIPWVGPFESSYSDLEVPDLSSEVFDLSSLERALAEITVEKPEPASNRDSKSASAPVTHNEYGRVIALKTIPLQLRAAAGGPTKVFHALLDGGAMGSLCSVEAAKALEAKGVIRKKPMTGVGGKTSEYDCFLSFFMLTLEDGTEIQAGLDVIPNPLGSLRPFPYKMGQSDFPHLANLTFPALESESEGVEILIGADIAYHSRSLEEIAGEPGQPIARRTPLGLTASGNFASPRCGPARRKNSAEVPLSGASLEGAALHLHVEGQRALMDYAIKSAGASVDIPFNFLAHDSSPSALEKVVKVDDFDLDGRLGELLDAQYDLQKIDLTSPDALMSEEERLALSMLHAKTRHDGTKYICPVLWRPNEPDIQSNYHSALVHASQQTKRFKRTEAGQNLLKLYHAVFDMWFEKGYIRDISMSVDVTEPSHYLHHRPHCREDAASTKIRPVFNASLKRFGKSVNDAMYTGPNLINDVAGVLTKFRRYDVAVGGDVKEMYLRVHMEEKDKPFHRFILETLDGVVKIMEFHVFIFGSRCSPSVCIFATHDAARRFADSCPEASKAILEATIIDDFLWSCETEQQAKKLMTDAVRIYGFADMTLHKLTCNRADVLSDFPEESKASERVLTHVGVSDDGAPVQKVLGMIYDCPSDTFTFLFSVERPKESWTKRIISSNFHRLYDPLGLILPFLMLARLVYRMICESGTDWDEPVDENIVAEWEKWAASADALSGFVLPRCFNDSTNDEVSFHVFCDASEKAHGAVVYCVNKTKQTVRLVRACGTVTKKDCNTIPRAELFATVQGTHIARAVSRDIETPLADFTFYSDSQIALAWLKSVTKAVKQWVGARARAVREYTQAEQWRYVRSELNPADVLSRGLFVEDLLKCDLYNSGPAFLLDGSDPGEAPPVVMTPDIAKEIKEPELIGNLPDEEFHLYGVEVIPLSKKETIILDPPTEWFHMVLRAAMLLRWSRITKGLPVSVLTLSKRSVSLCDEEFEAAELVVLRQHQRLELSDVFEKLASGSDLLQAHPLAPFRPFVDEQGILRVNSRASTTEEAFDVRYPIILPEKSKLTPKIMKEIHHHLLKHVGGKDTLFYRFAERFYSPGAKEVAKAVCRACLFCRRTTKRPIRHKPPMSSLPPYRIPADRFLEPFKDIGVDLAGPFFVKQGRANKKLWVFLVVCTVTRAVHLSFVLSPGTEDTMLALREHIARSRRPRLVLCDNGTGFVGTKNEIQVLEREALESGQWDKAQLQRLFPGVLFSFIPPGASHFGGHYERMVGVVKNAFRRLSPRFKEGLEINQWMTLLAEAENFVNSRPLQAVSIDPRDPLPIRPCDFLLTGAYDRLAPLTRHASILEKARLVHEAIEHFQEKFIQEIRPEMHRAAKWYGGDDQPIKVGDIVGLLETSVTGHWPLARVVEILPGKDGVVRRVMVVSERFERNHDKSLKPMMRATRDLIRFFDDKSSF